MPFYLTPQQDDFNQASVRLRGGSYMTANTRMERARVNNKR